MKKILIINSGENKGYVNNVVKPLIKLQENCDNIHITIKSGYTNHYDYDYIVFNEDFIFNNYTVPLVSGYWDKRKYIFYIDKWWQLPKTHPKYRYFKKFQIKSVMSLRNRYFGATSATVNTPLMPSF